MIPPVSQIPPGLSPRVLVSMEDDEQDVFRLAFGSILAEGADAGQAMVRARQAVQQLHAIRMLEKAFDPNQPRAEDGKWTSGGGGGTAPKIEPGEGYNLLPGGYHQDVYHFTSEKDRESIISDGKVNPSPNLLATASFFTEDGSGKAVAYLYPGWPPVRVVGRVDADRVINVDSLGGLHNFLINNGANDDSSIQGLAQDLKVQAIRINWSEGAELMVFDPTVVSNLRKSADPGVVEKASRTLYVHRPLLNGDDVRAWAATQGIKSTLRSGDMHVTVAHSKVPVDWSSLRPDEETLTVLGGARFAHQFAPKAKENGALVLRFESPALDARWSAFLSAGASWDFPEYSPHVTLTYSVPEADVGNIEPYAGPLVLGPEVFGEVNEGWADDIVEVPVPRGSIQRRRSGLSQ